MGTYNPNRPYVLGVEWVPIKDDTYIPTTTEELGYSFVLAAPTTVSEARFYVEEPAIEFSSDDGFQTVDSVNLMYVYPKGTESATGPMKSVTIPCNGGVTTGDVETNLAGFFTVEQALAAVGDGRYVTHTTPFVGPVILGELEMYFDVMSYPELVGKRIANVELMIAFRVAPGIAPGNGRVVLYQKNLDTFSLEFLADTAEMLSKSGDNFNDIQSVTLPPFNAMWDRTPGSSLAIFPWNYEALARFDANATVTPQALVIDVGIPYAFDGAEPNREDLEIDYAALRVTYCEEQRVAVTGMITPIRDNTNISEVQNPDLAGVGVLLPAGEYTVTIDGFGRSPEIFAPRELYPMRDQPPIVVERTTKVGESFQTRTPDQIPQLSLHTTTTTVVGIHGYGQQIHAPVYAGNFPNTQIRSDANGALVDYPWARFYARRFGNTTQPLSLRRNTIPTITQSITVADFDALPEITDGWKEVTLKFNPPVPQFTNSGANNTYEWVSNTGPGDLWEILSATSTVYSGLFPFPQITGTQDLGETTYGGESANLTWNGFNDTQADGILFFAQEMPAVSGLSVLTQTLAVTGIGQECGINPACIPTGISYNNITWTMMTTASMPATGFGHYELQRFDTFDAEWSTILNANSPVITGYKDYEARIGVESRYRIRFVHRMNFPSAWSAEVAVTIPAPGVTGNSVGNSSIVFTTNEIQDGSSSLAYTMVWEDTPDEDFTFIEAGDVVLQKMYGRDFQMAFRPLERGGERFQRTLLVQAAAVPTGLIRTGFTSLRDLAWEQVSYVCVRNELGDRWYATVIVPSGNVTRNRRLYLAQVEIVEVTDTPSIVYLPLGSGPGGSGSGGTCVGPALWDQNPGWDIGCWS